MIEIAGRVGVDRFAIYLASIGAMIPRRTAAG
jgi:hypothetical protein